jgi:hypothetical protein
VTRPITFSLMGDDFGTKNVDKEHAEHLINCLKEKYKLTKDWAGDLYCGISLRWDYAAWTLNISMPGYIEKQLLKIQAHNAMNTALPILIGAKKIWCRCIIPPPQQRCTKIHQ